MTTPGSSESVAAPKGSELQRTARRARSRRILAWLGLIVVIAGAVLSSNMFSVRDRLFGSAVPKPALPPASRDAFARSANAALAPTRLRSLPWWQEVTILTGSGSTTSSSFTIRPGASQWRVKASCRSGRLLVRALGQPKPLLSTACPAAEAGYATQTGAIRVQVISAGAWRLQVAQQIDVPLVEPPLPAMTSRGATKPATGSFYNIEQTGTGRLTVYRQADGRFSLRLDHFFVSPNADLELRLSTLKAPRTSGEVISAPSKLVARMDATAGSLNYAVPAGIDPPRFRSLVVWCALTSSAYAAASLAPAR